MPSTTMGSPPGISAAGGVFGKVISMEGSSFTAWKVAEA
jgi:hypothetical protein